MNDSLLFGLMQSNDIIIDLDYMTLTDYSEIIFDDMKLCLSQIHTLYLLSNLVDSIYRTYSDDINQIREVWNTQVQKHINMVKLIDKI